MNPKPQITTFVIWLVLLVVLGAFGIYVLDWTKYHRLAKSAVQTEGSVVSKEPANDRSIHYSFKVNDRLYSGVGNAGGINPEFDQLNVGDPVKVSYDPENPEESFLGNAKEQSDSITRGVLFLAVVGSLASVIGLYAKGWLPAK